MSTDASSRSPVDGAPLVVRDILGQAWPLFKACLPLCLPLAVAGVAACATPGAESVASGEGHGFAHGREWWGLAVASILLTLICHGAMLHQQLALAAGARVRLMESLQRAARLLPASLGLMLVPALTLATATLAAVWRGFGALVVLLTLVGLVLLVHALFAWPVLIARALSPFAALAASIAVVRGRWRWFAGLAATLVAVILVYALLVGILIGMVMGLAGQAVPTAGGLAFSRWLMALVLAVPAVYSGAVIVTAWRRANPALASPTGSLPPPKF